MSNRLFLLDGMALVYRAHFALLQRPVFTSKRINTSALYGFTQLLLDLTASQKPTHLAVALDTEVPTARHRLFPDYKAQREAMPEDIAFALPQVRRMAAALRVPVLTCDGYEADDIIGTLVTRAEAAGFESFMVTSDKDFAQLVSPHTRLYRPGRMGGDAEVLGLDEIRAEWGVERPDQVIDVLGLWGDASDNIPGVPGIGEKTAAKLIAQYGSIEALLERTEELKGRLRETLMANRAQALLCKQLATIDRAVPLDAPLESLRVQPPDEAALRALLIEFEFNSIGRRVFGDGFKAGRGFDPLAASAPVSSGAPASGRLAPAAVVTAEPPVTAPASAALRTLADVPHRYELADSADACAHLARALAQAESVGIAVDGDVEDPRRGVLRGLAFSVEPGAGWYVPIPSDPDLANDRIRQFAPALGRTDLAKTAHDFKPILALLRRRGVTVGGRLFDVMLAHALAEPELRHSFSYLCESLLGYSPLAGGAAAGAQAELALGSEVLQRRIDEAVERAELALRLRTCLEPMVREKSQTRVLDEIEAPLIRVLVDMEFEGIRIDAGALAEFGTVLRREMEEQERAIQRLAGLEFNVNSAKRLGEVLFDVLRIAEAPKKTRTGQYATDEQTLALLAGDHEIVRRLLEYRAASKLKSTYADALPAAVDPRTGRVHTTYQQLATSTGRLNSINPNLQNIPIRTGLGQEIRKAFVPRDPDYLLLSADYSQIELRIIAALSGEEGLIEAFRAGGDVHRATAARVFGVSLEQVTSEMRKQAKMVNYGIAYGISAFGLAQRLGIPRRQAAEIIEHYFARFPGIKGYMNRTIEFARQHGYAETVTGRRRYLRDIRSSNGATRSAAERNAINAPIQGTAADMIKIAMATIHGELVRRRLRTRMLLQVHDELVFDLHRSEQQEVTELVMEKMCGTITLAVPIEVDVGVGTTWLEAHG